MRRKFLYMMLMSLSMAFAGCANNPAESGVEAVNLIFETDMGNDVDDALALDMIYKYMDAGKVNLLAITLNKEGVAPAEFLDIMGTWYGYTGTPVGVVRNGAFCETDALNYAQAVVELKDEGGEKLFERSSSGYENLPDAHILYRKVLAAQPDNSVTVVSVGFSTNLARLLETGPDEFSPLSGKELVAKKVKLLCTMAGNIADPNFNEYNVVKDIPAAKKVFSEWPGTVVTSPFEVGIGICYPGSSIENDFKWAENHPMVEAYKSYLKMPYDRPTWDLTSVLYVVEGDSWFTMSAPGRIEVTEKGGTVFTPDESGNRYYMSVDAQQAERIKAHFVELISSEPKNHK